MKICRGVFDRCSSARMTWVIAEVVVVDDVGQVVDERAVGALDDVVRLLAPRELDGAAHEVAAAAAALARHLQAHDALAALGLEARAVASGVAAIHGGCTGTARFSVSAALRSASISSALA